MFRPFCLASWHFSCIIIYGQKSTNIHKTVDLVLNYPEMVWLVVLTILKNMKVNGKDDIPYMKWKIKFHVPNHQSVISGLVHPSYFCEFSLPSPFIIRLITHLLLLFVNIAPTKKHPLKSPEPFSLSQFTDIPRSNTARRT